MAQAGDIYTFTALFLDGLNTPIVVNDPSIEIFAFDSEGTKIELVPSGTPMNLVETEVGRYFYTYPIPLDYSYAPTIFAIMQGVEPLTLFNILIEEQLHVTPIGGGDHECPKMISQFVKGG